MQRCLSSRFRTGVEYLQKMGLGEEFRCRQRLGSFGLESARHLEKVCSVLFGKSLRSGVRAWSVVNTLPVVDENHGFLGLSHIKPEHSL